ncbi:PP2C family serine/threonine-protein phosphatase [Photobacterium gaetbulicola]|nr:PP2C family serine/threonine-protein phosphatase [Photobacterium gaetbulicola]
MLGHYQPLMAQSYLLTQDPESQISSASEPVWNHCSEAVAGFAHRKRGQVCQDAAESASEIRPMLVVCDGAGSAPASSLGSAGLAVGMKRLIATMEPLLQSWLDTGDGCSAALLTELLSHHAEGIFEDLAAQHMREKRDFRSTLLVGVVGKVYTYWAQVGDGYVIGQDTGGSWRLLNQPDMGEFAGQTFFVGSGELASNLRYGLVPTGEIKSLVAMSDGTGEQLVCQRTGEISAVMMDWLRDVTVSANRGKYIFQFLSDHQIWGKTTGDDKSLAMLVKQ